MVSVNTNGNSSALIQVRGLDKTYWRGGEKIDVLQGLNLDVDKGDFVAFMGPERVRKNHPAQSPRRPRRSHLRHGFRGRR